MDNLENDKCDEWQNKYWCIALLSHDSDDWCSCDAPRPHRRKAGFFICENCEFPIPKISTKPTMKTHTEPLNK